MFKNIRSEYLYGGLALGVIVIVGLFLLFASGKNPISDEVTLDRVVFHGYANDIMFVRIPFIASSEKYSFTNVGIDINQDQVITDDEWIIRNYPVSVQNETASRYSFRLRDRTFDSKIGILTRVVLSREMIQEFSDKIPSSIEKTLVIPAVGTQEVGNAFYPNRTRDMETGFFPSAFADHGEHSELPATPETPSYTDTNENTNGSTDTMGDLNFTIEKDTTDMVISPKITFSADNTWTASDKYYGEDYEFTMEKNGDIDLSDIPTLVLDEPKVEVPAETPIELPQPATPPPAPAPVLPHTINYDDMPDRDQKYNECAPTAVSNSFRWLAKKYGFEDKIPGVDQELIDELKGYMDWDMGVGSGGTLQGKKDFIKERELPIEAHMIGDYEDPDIMSKILLEMSKGQAVEISMQFYVFKDGVLVKDGAHLVAVSGIADYTDSGGNKWITISDPGTWEKDGKPGRDTYQVSGTTLLNYWPGGVTKIRYAVAQSPIFKEDGGLIDIGSNSELQKDANGLTLPDQTVTRAIGQFGFFHVDISGIGDHYVGDTFPVSLSVVDRKKENTIRWDGQAYKVKMAGPWKIKGSFANSLNISPTGMLDTPPLTQVNGDRYTLDVNVTCEKAGPAYVGFTAHLSWEKSGEGPVPDKIQAEYGSEIKNTDIINVTAPVFNCIEKPVDGTISDDSPRTAVEVEKPFSCTGFEPDAEGKEIELLKLGGKCYPKHQFRGGGNAHDACGAEHYHGAMGDIVYSLDGSSLLDPAIPACGFGKIAEVEHGTLKLTPDQMGPFISVAGGG